MSNRVISPKKFSLIAACCNNRGIGKDNDLPWRIRKDMNFFNSKTSQTEAEGKKNAVIMGRKTWYSIPEKYRPLTNRINVVLSSQLKECPQGADHLTETLEQAIALLSQPPLCEEVDLVWIVGGSGVYKEALASPLCHRIYLTRVMGDFDCDTFFPEFAETVFKRIDDPTVESDLQEEKGIKFQFEVYEKKQ